MRRPIVLIPACTRDIGFHPYHAVQVKYVDAVARGADCAPLLLPALGADTDLETVLALADGILLSGAASNVHPSHYAQGVRNPELPQDHARDATTLPLIRAAIKRAIPLFAVCRGFQEVNVALGGSLHQAVQEVEGMMDHREDELAPLEQQYSAAHKLALEPAGRLAALLGAQHDIVVNSLHGQGVDRLAEALQAEARAPDGLVEAFSVTASPTFALGVQWHPEWHFHEDPVSLALFSAFGRACREHQARRRRSE
ncbi:MAG: gamma-glutamyl-gamma-aminobutyrate hydrolase family protein [Pseudomonadota bacterium]